MDLPTTHHDASHSEKKSEVNHGSNGKGGALRKLAVWLLLAGVFLAPLVFIPSSFAPLDVVKTVFISICVLGAAILLAIDTLRGSTITYTPAMLCYSIVGVVISLILSALSSASIAKSFMGQGFEIGTASFLILMFVTVCLVKLVTHKHSEVFFKIYSAIFLSVTILIVFHLIRIFGGAGILSFGILSNVTSTVAGKWYDFGILVGLLSILSFLGVKFLPLSKMLKNLLFVVFALSFLTLFLINAGFLWFILAIVTALIMVYEFMVKVKKGTGIHEVFSRVSIFSLIVLVLALTFAFKGNSLVSPLMNKFGAQYAEATLPWQLTLDVTTDTLKESPILGAGPNRFGAQYLRFKPLSVNSTQFWNTEFPSGFALVSTFVATQGILGLVMWAIFFIFLIREGVRALKKNHDPLTRFLLSSSLFATLYLWVVAFVYTPTHVTVFMMFVLTGLYISALMKAGVLKEHEINIHSHKFGKVILIGVSLATIVLVVWLGAYMKRTVAITYFQKGIKSLSVKQDTTAAESYFKKALVWDNSDVYYQALSENNILKINTLTAQMQAESANGAAADQTKVQQVIDLITQSIKYSKTAESIDPNNYYNYIAEAHISEIGNGLKLPNAFENAKAAYNNSLKTNPANPGTYLALARLEATQSNFAEAEKDVGTALQLKPNYTEAVFFLSQLQVAQNKLSDAIISTQVAISLNPTEPLLYFQLGLLDYNAKDYSSAITTLQKAVDINPQYANARYFLGLAYARMGNNEKAIENFTELARTNPDNNEVAFILMNLKEGRSPFADAQAPIDNKPEKRKTLPVTEKTTQSTTSSSTPKTATSTKKSS